MYCTIWFLQFQRKPTLDPCIYFDLIRLCAYSRNYCLFWVACQTRKQAQPAFQTILFCSRSLYSLFLCCYFWEYLFMLLAFEIRSTQSSYCHPQVICMNMSWSLPVPCVYLGCLHKRRQPKQTLYDALQALHSLINLHAHTQKPTSIFCKLLLSKGFTLGLIFCHFNSALSNHGSCEVVRAVYFQDEAILNLF